MKKILALIGFIILLVLAAIVFLFSIETVFRALPFIGSIANIITVGWLHLWLPLCVVLSLIGLGLCLAKRKKTAYWVALALSVVSLAATVFFLCENASVRYNGAFDFLHGAFDESKEQSGQVAQSTYDDTWSVLLQLHVYANDGNVLKDVV